MPVIRQSVKVRHPVLTSGEVSLGDDDGFRRPYSPASARKCWGGSRAGMNSELGRTYPEEYYSSFRISVSQALQNLELSI